MPELQQPDIVGNFLSSYATAQAQQQAQQDRAMQQQRMAKQDGMAEQQFKMQQQKHQFDIAQQVVDMLGSVPDGDAQGFERAKQRWGQMGLPPEAVAGYTVADLPALRIKAGTQLRELQAKAQQASIDASRASAAKDRAATALIGTTTKPLPQKLQGTETELLGDIQLAANNNADVSMYLNKIKAGELDPGLLKNRYDQAKSWLGVVDPADTNAINYNNFLSDMKGLMNQSLRLNKGVQTEGDAQRAWDELFANLNDKNIVASRLERIAAINKRAAQQKAALIRNQRRNYFGKDYQEPNWGDFGFDASLVELPAAPKAVPGAPPPPAASAGAGNIPPPPPGFVVK